MDLLDLPSAAVRVVGDQRTSPDDRQVEAAVDAAAVSEVAPVAVQSTVRHARAKRVVGELSFHLRFSPAERPRELSLSLGQTAHTSERLWTTIEFIELGGVVADRDLWKAWELLAAEGGKGA